MNATSEGFILSLVAKLVDVAAIWCDSERLACVNFSGPTWFMLERSLGIGKIPPELAYLVFARLTESHSGVCF